MRCCVFVMQICKLRQSSWVWCRMNFVELLMFLFEMTIYWLINGWQICLLCFLKLCCWISCGENQKMLKTDGSMLHGNINLCAFCGTQIPTNYCYCYNILFQPLFFQDRCILDIKQWEFYSSPDMIKLWWVLMKIYLVLHEISTLNVLFYEHLFSLCWVLHQSQNMK